METRSRGGGAEQGLRKRARAGEPRDQPPPNGLYLVVEHETENKCEVIKPPSHAGAPFGAPGMSFVAVSSSNHGGDWIVGVGGKTTVTYDAGTSEVIRGPPVLSPKHQPVLISHGGMLYAITRRPRVVPWTDFEVLSFEDGIPSINYPYATEKAPPFFPCRLTPIEFRNPPEVCVGSYAAVDGRIFLSLQQEEGTCVFHVASKTWERVDDNNLPFIGPAAPLCDRMFAACTKTRSNNEDAITLFSLPMDGSTKWLPIREFVVGPTDHVSRQFLCPLPGGRSFCWINTMHPDSATSIQLNSKLKSVLATFTIFQLKNLEGNDDFSASSVTLEKLGKPGQLIHTLSEGESSPVTLIAALTHNATSACDL
ncbi:unnamed protein product [Triticum turgidum subsp. durum]|uniref:Uncharacterized protein n=1 Tax=Triticum turgidum subsp. durum TaxID=4567 RepID=A0A9R1BFU5_TRITD|nr:unnamed protein product [Triticum turgidum subsp. durum]